MFGSPQRGPGSTESTAAMERSLSMAGQEGPGCHFWAAPVQVCLLLLLSGLRQETESCINICFPCSDIPTITVVSVRTIMLQEQRYGFTECVINIAAVQFVLKLKSNVFLLFIFFKGMQIFYRKSKKSLSFTDFF